MSRAHHELLKRLCHDTDTLERAKSILHTASIKTAQGSGYELGQGLSGLPAICAYIAAEELGDTDVTEKIAQVASCLKPKVFKTTLNTVKAALSAASASNPGTPSKSSRRLGYTELLIQRKIGKRAVVLGWMQGAERTLMANREMRRKFGASYDALTVAVFCWACQLMGLKTERINAEALLEDYDVSQDQFDEITDALDELCQDVVQQIKADIASLKSGGSPTKASIAPSKIHATPSKPKQPTITPTDSVPPTPSRTPSKSSALTRSPSKSALRAPSADLSPRKTPSHKRKVAFDGPLEGVEEVDEDAFDALATPSKRQKFSSPMKEGPSTTASSPRKASRLAQTTAGAGQQEEGAASSSRETLDLLRHTREMASGSVPSTPRRNRIASQPSSTHSTRSVRSARSQPTTPTRRKPALPTVREDEERVTRRRYRPAFADTQQWLRGDTRLERALRPWTDRWRELVGKCGGDVWEAAKVASESRRDDIRMSAAA
ncbi:hypothetical protein C8Q70DRAFT_961499 [Cubamyces menziesii]|nr:hypothetical protein C8Q70DRAFT_961499 [Cubamyces menziesii]